MPRCDLDHLVLAAATLDAGASYVEELCGVKVPPGGSHPLMGTHNRLMQIGRGAFLEIIAVDADAPAPDRPRWYSLDAPETRERLAAGPVLLTWVVRTDDIEWAAALSPIRTGPVIQGRRGDLEWKITVPEDGSMPEGGTFPTLIQWQDFAGPVSNMANLGCRLESLTLRHQEPDKLNAALSAIGADSLADGVESSADGPAGLCARISTPTGVAAFQ